MQSFRRVNDYERSVLDKMLSYPFSGKESIQQQLESAVVRTLETGDNYGSIEFRIQKDAKDVNVDQRVPIELEAYDKDGVPIAALLHVIDGKVDELEIYKADGSPILKSPEATEFHLKVWAKEEK